MPPLAKAANFIRRSAAPGSCSRRAARRLRFGNYVNSILLVFAGLFPIVNPVGNAPIFLTLTRHCSMGERHSLAGKVAINSFILLTGSLFLGSYALEFFGITLPVLRIAGGLVVTAFGWKLLHAGDNPDERDGGGHPSTDLDAFYPLTMPLTIGPGSISVAVALGSQRPAVERRFH